MYDLQVVIEELINSLSDADDISKAKKEKLLELYRINSESLNKEIYRLKDTIFLKDKQKRDIESQLAKYKKGHKYVSDILSHIRAFKTRFSIWFYSLLGAKRRVSIILDGSDTPIVKFYPECFFIDSEKANIIHNISDNYLFENLKKGIIPNAITITSGNERYNENLRVFEDCIRDIKDY